MQIEYKCLWIKRLLPKTTRNWPIVTLPSTSLALNPIISPLAYLIRTPSNNPDATPHFFHLVCITLVKTTYKPLREQPRSGQSRQLNSWAQRPTQASLFTHFCSSAPLPLDRDRLLAWSHSDVADYCAWQEPDRCLLASFAT